MAASRRKTNPYISRAAAQALVRFGPELSALVELQRTAEDTYRSTVAGARASSDVIQGAVDEARPRMRDVYDRAGLDQARMASSFMSPELSRLGPGADAIKAAAATGAAGAARRLSEAQTQALGDLDDRRVRAAEGVQWAQTAAKDRLVSDLAKVLQRRQDLAAESGAFQAATVGDLEDAARDRALRVRLEQMGNAQSERNSLRSSGVDPDTGKRLPNAKGAKRLPGGAKLQTTSAHSSFKDKLNATLAVARPLVEKATRDGIPRSQLAQILLSGVKGGTVHDPATGRVQIDPDSGLAVQTPSIKAQPEFLTSLALDLLLDEHVSRRNLSELHRRGYSSRQLGVTSYGEWLKRQKKGGAKKAATRGIGQDLATSLGSIPRVGG